MTAQQQTHEPSWLWTTVKWGLVGGAAVAGVAYGGEALAETLSEYATETPEGFWQKTAASVGDGLGDTSQFLQQQGENLGKAFGMTEDQLKDGVNGKLIASMAAAGLGVGLGTVVKGVSGSHNQENGGPAYPTNPRPGPQIG